MIKMEKCPQCEKSMPKHILVKHLKKTHNIEWNDALEVQKQTLETVTSPEEPKKVDNYVPGAPITALGPTTLAPEPKKWYERWDAGEIGTCAQCKTEWPSKLMSFHLKLEHGL